MSERDMTAIVSQQKTTYPFSLKDLSETQNGISSNALHNGP